MKRWIIALAVLLVISLAGNVTLVLTAGKESKVSAAETSRKISGSKLLLTEAMQKQHREQLNSLRKLAVEEGATKIADAIDVILAGQRKQFEQTVKRTAEEQRAYLKEQSIRKRIREPLGDQ